MIGAKITKQYAFYADPVVHRALSQLNTWLTWLTNNGAKGYIGEAGWQCFPNADYARWNNVATAYYNQLQGKDVLISTWAADGKQRPSVFALQQFGRSETNNVQGLAFATTATNIPAKFNHNGIITCYHSQYISSPTLLDGTLYSNINPGTFGTVNTDCIYPSNSDMAFLASHGVKVVRMSFRWERLYPVLGGPLDVTELARLQTAVSTALANGIRIILCPFSFGSYWLGTDTMTRTEYKLTTDTAATFNINHFVDFWTKLSTVFKGNAGIYAYDLMNEPQGMSAITGPYGTTLLSNGTFETGITGWASPATTAIAQSSVQARTGTYSMSITSVVAGNIVAWSPTISSVIAGQDYYGEAYVRTGSAARLSHLQIDWKNSAGTVLSAISGTSVTSTTTGWTKITIGGTAPAGCTKFNMDVILTSTLVGEVFYVDDILVQNSVNLSPEKQWEQISQAVVTAVRANTDTTLMMIPGYAYSAMKTWTTYHSVGWITDSANNFRYTAHHYWNTYGDGATVTSFAQEITDAIGAGY